MTTTQILVLIGLVAALAAFVRILANGGRTGSAPLAAALAIGFAFYTLVTIAREGVVPLWLNQTTSLWGVQVWYDLLVSLTLALFLIAPRARRVGMRLAPWFVLVAATGSIGLLAMVARLLWIERRSQWPG